jgi:hypothetical protein
MQLVHASLASRVSGYSGKRRMRRPMFFVLLRFRKVDGTFALRVAVVTRMLLNLSAHCIQSPNRQVKSLPNLS